MFAGDFCSKNPENIKLSDSLMKSINSCDIKCLNFEAPLAYGKLNSPNKSKLDQSNNSPSWSEENGFNIISLANNHMFDYGVEGLLATKKAFKESITLGAGTWDEAYKVKFIDIKGVRIGFFSGTSCDFASLKDVWTDKNKIGCAWINQKEVNNIISSAKKECDYLIVLSHGGVEFMDVPLPEWRDRYRELIDMGADAIIGSHPHVPQGVEKYNGKPIFYSLGNFFFDNDNAKKPMYWDNGILAVLEIENDKIRFQSIPIIKTQDFLNIDTSEKSNHHLKYISNILNDDVRYLEQVNNDVLRLYVKYQEWLLLGFRATEIKITKRSLLMLMKALILPNLNHKGALHQLRDESTRWLLIRALKLKSNSKL